MLNDLKLYMRYMLRILLWLGPIEFLTGRVIARAARQSPAGDAMGAFFNLMSEVGAFLVTPALLLVIAMLLGAALLGRRGGAAAWNEAGPGWPRLLGPLLLGLLVISAALLPGEPAMPLLVAYALVSAAVVLGVGATVVAASSTPLRVRVTLGLFVAAYAAYYVFAILGALGQGGNDPALGDARVAINAFGEACAMAAAISLLWTAGPCNLALAGRPWFKRISVPRLLIALVPTLFYMLSVTQEEWLQSVTTQFTVGFTLFLPVPITALALFAYVYALLTCCGRKGAAETGLPWAWEFGAALLLLPVAGYQLQLSYQHLMMALVMLLLAGLIRPFSRASEEVRPARPTVPIPSSAGNSESSVRR